MAKMPKRNSHGFNMYEARDLLDKEKWMNQITGYISPLVYDEAVDRKDRRKRVWCCVSCCMVLPHNAIRPRTQRKPRKRRDAPVPVKVNTFQDLGLLLAQ